jgi:hypothetical protein
MHACVDDSGSEDLPVVLSGNSPAKAGEANLPHNIIGFKLVLLSTACLL